MKNARGNLTDVQAAIRLIQWVFGGDDAEYEGITNAEELPSVVTEVLDSLTPRERRVLRLRCGLEDGRPRTFEEVGKTFMVTRERIRQIEAKALRKIRKASHDGWTRPSTPAILQSVALVISQSLSERALYCQQ